MLLRFGIRSVRSVLLSALFVVCGPGSPRAIDVGDPAPDFRLTDLDGLDHNLSGYANHPVLLMFFACDEAVSIALGPLVQSDLYTVYVPRGLRILGIDCRGSTLEQMNHYRNQTGVRFPLLLDGQQTQAAYQVPVSSFVLVDGGGTVRYLSLGPGIEAYDPAALRGAVEETLREANNTKEATWGLIKGLYSD